MHNVFDKFNLSTILVISFNNVRLKMINVNYFPLLLFSEIESLLYLSFSCYFEFYVLCVTYQIN